MGRLILLGICCITANFIVAQDSLAPACHLKANFVWVKGGKVHMGNSEQADAQPFFTQKVKGFWMQRHEVSNAEFTAFVAATGYRTLAERNGASYVFKPYSSDDETALPGASWWHYTEGANWKHPEGIGSDIIGKENYPVVHIAFEDAIAYCTWANVRLPTEVEREYAARKNGEIASKNVWQGSFPDTNTLEDGFAATSPIGSFPAGKIGLFDMQGNVWEWCQDPYHSNAYQRAREVKNSSTNCLVPKYFDPSFPQEETRVIRGGSFLCAENYCCGYKLGRRMRSSVKMSFSHIGFRCVQSK